MRHTQHSPTRCTIVPPYLLVRLARLDDPRFGAAAEAARRSLLRDVPLREQRADAPPPLPTLRAPSARERGRVDRAIWDAVGQERLPGRLLARSEGWPATSDPAVNEAYDGLGQTHALFWTRFGRDS